MNRDNHLIFEALKLHNYEKQDHTSDGSGRELKYFKDKVKGFLEQGKEPSVEQLEQAIDKAMLYTNPKFFMLSLHNELLHMRGKKRKALDIPYLPPEGKADYQFIKDWLKREMIGELMVHRSGPMHHENEEDMSKSPFHYDPMHGLAGAAHKIKDELRGAANDEARPEHIEKMAEIILGPQSEYASVDHYKKALSGVIELLNHYVVVPMN